MALHPSGIFVGLFPLFVLSPVSGYPLSAGVWITDSSVSVSEGDVECFSEYMELWIHRARIEGLRLWLSGMMRIQVSLGSLEQLNQQLSACGFALHKDPEKNYIFRVMYSGCFVQLQHGSYVIELNLLKRIHRFGGRSHNYLMRCPTVSSPPNREHIQCDPDSIQVTREIPLDSWNKELQWFLALRGNLVVALEDASLIQVNVERKQSNITVQGRRREILRPVLVMENKGEFLPLKLVSGHYAYSMEATCPDVSRSVTEMTVLHIFKRRMGLTKRGGYENETLSISSVVVQQTDKFTWSESRDFVQLVIPTVAIQHSRSCMGKQLLQPFFRVDVVLTFKETNHKMHWTMENTLPCMRSSSLSYLEPHPSSTSPLPVFPTYSIFSAYIHPMNLTPKEKFTETLLKNIPSLTTATAPLSKNITTSAMTITPQFQRNQEQAYTTAEPRGGQHSEVKSSTTLKTSQAFTSKQQLLSGVLEDTESTSVVDESTGRTQTMKQTPGGTGQARDRTLSQQYDEHFPFSETIHQSPQEFSAPNSEEKTGISEATPTIPVVAVKSNVAVTATMTHDQRVALPEASSLEYVQKTHGPRYASQMGEKSSTMPPSYETDKSIRPSPQTKMFTSEQASTYAHVSQPATLIATQRHLETMPSMAQTTDRTLKSIRYLPFTSHYPSSTVSHQNRPTLLSSPSEFIVAEVQTTDVGVPSLDSKTAPTEPMEGTFSAPMTFMAALGQSAALSGTTIKPLHPINSTPDSSQALVPSQFPVTTERSVRPTDMPELMRDSTLAGNSPSFNTETHFDKERSTVSLFRQFTTLKNWIHGSDMTTESLHYANTWQTKDTKAVYTHPFNVGTFPIDHQRSPKDHTTLRPAQTTAKLPEDQSSNTTTSESRVVHKTSDILHLLLQTKSVDFSQTQATSAPVTTLSNTHEPQHRALSTPTPLQPKDEGMYFETAPTCPSTLHNLRPSSVTGHPLPSLI